MTQQEMIYELNKMVIGYNITWDKIKYDADKAIMKINAHLGAEYPMMSKIMTHAYHRYTLKQNNREVPIFPERYILTVVLPYIATEVLARDEEFTTIYNKYAMDFENGLFEMFQNEYNKVPLVFRQDPDIGVFFDKGTKEHHYQYCKSQKLPEFKYNVYYHINNKHYHGDTKFTIDIRRYDYNDSVVLLDSTIDEFIDGIYVYRFNGWAIDNDTSKKYDEGDTVFNIDNDLHLYAQWLQDCILDIDSTGTISINPNYKTKITYLDIPMYVEGKLVTKLAEDFAKGSTLYHIGLPQTNLDITKDSLSGSDLREIIFPRYDYLRSFPRNIIIRSNALRDTQVPYLYLPYSIKMIETDAIQGVQTISIEHEDIPASWGESWTDTDNIKVGVSNV